MLTVSPRTFGLHADVPEAALDPEWRALVSQQAYTLAAMPQRIQTAVTEGQRRTDAFQLQILVADAERFLAAQAQQHVVLERELVQLREMVTDLTPAPAELTQRVQRLERVIAVLHANLAAARQYLATVLPQVS